MATDAAGEGMTGSPLGGARERMGQHLRGKRTVLWRRPDPTPRLLAVMGGDADAVRVSDRLGRLRRREIRGAAMELAAFMANLAAAASLGVLLYERWPGEHPVANALFLAVAVLGTIHFGVRIRGRVVRGRRAFGGGDLHPSEARPVDIALTPGGIHVAGMRGAVRVARFEHIHALSIEHRGGGDHAVRFLTCTRDGTSVFAEASRVDEESCRALVEAVRWRIPRLLDDAARYAGELDARTVVLPPATFAAALAAVESGRYPTVEALARSAVERTLSAA